ncbi:MAG: amidohydrolase [Butyricicoccus pullicaecorum]|nr:amidohydrolase [Butyricicoccus pullicaecorum]
MKDILIRNAYVLPMEGAAYENGYVLVRNGTIAAVGDMSNLPINSEAEEIDAAGGWVMPGLIDIHSHLGLYEDGLGFEGADGNEDTDPVTPHLRVIDGINPMERAFRESLEAGVTAVVVSPGSANPIGGQLAAIKTWGRRIDDMVIVEPVGIKFAFGENPKGVYHDKEETPVTRMATAALIRENLRKAQEYHDRKRKALENEEEDLPDFDAKLESLELLITGKLPAHIHAHRADDIFTALRICKEFGVKPVLVHGTEGHLVADLLAEEGVPVVSGPYMTDRSKPELQNLTEAAPGLLKTAGVPVAITTDHPEIPVKFLRLAAGVAVQAGMDEMDALRAITIDAAKIAGLDHRIGSLVPGKDADVLVLSGYPFDFRSRVQAVLSSGAIAYRRNNI